MPEFTHNLLLHPRTAAQVEAFLQNPSHALLLTGAMGSGKPALARAVSANLLGLDEVKLDTYPYFLWLSVPEKKQEIPIEAVRELIDKLKLTTPGTPDIRRLVVIEDAQFMSQESQNALLKTLEEPGPDTVFILTAPSGRHVAPTIASRAQQIEVGSVTRQAAVDYFVEQFGQEEIEANWLLSAGAPGLLNNLLNGNLTHPLKSAVDDFKTFLASDDFGRLIDAERLARDKTQLGYFLDAGSRVLRALQPRVSDRQGQKLTKARKQIIKLQKALEANANPRLVATELALNLKI